MLECCGIRICLALQIFVLFKEVIGLASEDMM